MLKDSNATATIAVKDLGAAKRFYESVVGLTPLPATEPGVAPFRTGTTSILVYESQFAGTNRATAATWMVEDDLEGVVQALKAKGVTFEHYDFPGMKREGDLHVTGKSRAAWFKDPDGNILALVGR
jgi:catechol-2,3-dioxygenase